MRELNPEIQKVRDKVPLDGFTPHRRRVRRVGLPPACSCSTRSRKWESI